jgi:lysophospholipase L1-like esterase
MFNKNGTIKKDIFLDDNLHMNPKGYYIWQKLIQPHLVKTNNKK